MPTNITAQSLQNSQNPCNREETNSNNESEVQVMPTLPDEIFPSLPDFLQSIVKVATSNEERDILLLGSIVALSACLPKVIGYYDDKKVNANLFLFITAQASSLE